MSDSKLLPCNNSLEDGEVERETEADGVSRWELGDRNVRRGLVSLQRFVRTVLPLVAGCEFSEVAVVIAHPVQFQPKSAPNQGLLASCDKRPSTPRWRRWG